MTTKKDRKVVTVRAERKVVTARARVVRERWVFDGTWYVVRAVDSYGFGMDLCSFRERTLAHQAALRVNAAIGRE